MLGENKQQGLAVFYAFASEVIGGGHVMRCMVLAQAMIYEGMRCIFVCDQKTLDTIPELKKTEIDVRLIGSDQISNPDHLAGKLENGCDWLIIDNYSIDYAFEIHCRQWAKKILIIDDLADRKHDCDLLLDQTLGRVAEDYHALVPKTCQLLLGPTYALLRPEFQASRQISLKRRQNIRRPENILVSFGVMDSANATSWVLSTIKNASILATIDVVLGVNAPHRNKVAAICRKMGAMARLWIGPANIAELLTKADIAIGASGSSAWERCCLGLPSIIVTIGENQQKSALELESVGAAIRAGSIEEINNLDLLKLYFEFDENPGKLGAMSNNAKNICDGCGVQKILRFLKTESK